MTVGTMAGLGQASNVGMRIREPTMAVPAIIRAHVMASNRVGMAQSIPELAIDLLRAINYNIYKVKARVDPPKAE